MTYKDRIERMGIVFKKRSESKLFKHFGSQYWTTIGQTIYHPDNVNNPYQHPEVIDHELVHVKQQKESALPLWLWLAWYVANPLFRWHMERSAYLTNIVNHGWSVNSVCNMLKGYAIPIPTHKQRKKWFMDQLEEMKRSGILSDD